MAVSREALFEEVWAEPMLKVAARHGVSSNFLARVCERLNVPHPRRGYWQQLEVGKADHRSPPRFACDFRSPTTHGHKIARPTTSVS